MREFYMDTNVFISQLKPDDPYHSEAEIIAKGLERDEIQASTSVLALLEVASVAGRFYEAKKGAKGTERERRIFIVKTLRRLAGLKVRFVHVAGDSSILVRSIRADVPGIFNEALLLSLRTSLRTLDLIHLAAAKHAKQVNRELGAFVTGDDGFLTKKEELSKILSVPILSPKEYVEALGL